MTTTPAPTDPEPDDAGVEWVTFEAEPASELVPKKLRTAVYFTALAVAALGILAVGQVDVWAPQYSARIDESWDRIDDWLLFVTGALGVAYRPTRR